jgi:A/G-specific adenine glycosylase
MDTKIRKLLAWYKINKRDLPWRDIDDAYRIFISELMLQQTQVDRVIPLYHAFLHTFPNWSSLANASTSDLIHAWAGLGYNRRALYAREAARAVVARGVPTMETEWRTLKGVGPYMAAALTEFVNHRRALVIDTNVRRVIGRLFLKLPFPRPEDDEKIFHVLQRVTPTRKKHWDLPQALMDLGSSTCLARVPLCATCPLNTVCATRTQFSQTNLIKTLATKQTKKTRERIHGEKPFPDRIYRGRILALVRKNSSMHIAALGELIDPAFDRIADGDWIHAMTQRLIADGLLALHSRDIITLP